MSAKSDKTLRWRRGIIEDVKRRRALEAAERDRRKFFGETTADDIVDEVSKAFAADLDRVMKPVIAPHDFVLHAPSGIRICQRCGRPETKRVRLSDCPNTTIGGE